MFKKFFTAILAMILSLGIFSNVEAAEASYCYKNVEEVIEAINKVGFNLQGIEYYTYEGAKRCEGYFFRQSK